jgi:hypothetical protein
MKKVISLLMAAAITPAVTISAPAAQGPVPVTVVRASSATTGLWIVGGIGVGVISVIVRAGIVGKRENRELTSEEATGAFLLPFFWIVYPGNLVGQTNHTRRDGSIEADNYNYQQRQFRRFQDADIGQGTSVSGQVLGATRSNKPPKPGTSNLSGSRGSQKN